MDFRIIYATPSLLPSCMNLQLRGKFKEKQKMNTKMSTIQLILLYVVSLVVEHVTVAQNSPADYLRAHNNARAQVAVGAMVWNTTVAAYAQNYANRMASTCNLAHSIGGQVPYGENLASAGSSTFTGTEAVNLWVSEKQYYNNSTRSCASGEVCSHYLQVIWPKSIHLGCARVVCNNNVGTLIICSYDPPDGCQSQCRPAGATPTPTPGEDLRSLIPESLFNEMLKHRSDPACQGGFYTYDAFIAAARSFDGFASVCDSNLRKREIAAFFAQTSHETTGGWPTAPDGPFAWGYCVIQEQGANPAEYCSPAAQLWPCVFNRTYFGRGPIQLSWNYNYGQAGTAIGEDILNNPDLVSSDPIISFKTALWFWMTPQSPKPSSHDVITGRWTPSDADRAAGRVPGFGVITNIINGGLECGQGPNESVANRIGFYKRYCNMLGVTPGDNLDCNNQRP